MDAVNGADATVVLTEWNEFRALDLSDLKAAMRGDVLVDLRNVFRPDLARAAGFSYSSIGRDRNAGGKS
jgi:UDPglucose 6-dehydrogenase